MVLGAPLAFADGGHAGPPDASGVRAYCSVSVNGDYPASGTWTGYIRCTVGAGVSVTTSPSDIVAPWKTNGSESIGMDIGTWAEVTDDAWEAPLSLAGGATGAPRSVMQSCTQTTSHPGNKCVYGTIVLSSGTIAIDSASGSRLNLSMGAYSSSPPSWPTHYWTSAPGAQATVPAPSIASCARTLAALPSGFGSFSAVRSGALPANAADTWSWSFGDSGTASTRRAEHTYSPPPTGSNAVVATATLTRALTNASAHTFTDGTTANKTATCSLLVDFANPEETDPGSIDTEDPSACPSGLGWLNPVSALKCLFMPTSFGEDFSALSTAAEGNYPLGPLVWVGTTASDFHADFRDGLTAGAADCGSGINNSENNAQTDVGIPIPGTSDVVSVVLLPNCLSDIDSAWGTAANFLHGGLTLMLWVGCIMAVYRIVTGTMGGSAATEGDG